MARDKTKKAPKGSPSTDGWWGAVEQTPRDDSADVANAEKRFRVWRWVIVATVVLAPIVTLAAASVIVDGGNAAASGPVADAVGPGRAEATLAVEQWLASANTPLPGGRVLSWDSSSHLPWSASDKGTTNELPAYELWVHHFTVTNLDGSSLYAVAVRVTSEPGVGATVQGNPSLVPIPVAGTLPSANVWPGWKDASASRSVVETVQQWVESYTSGDATKLRLSVGDPNDDHSYVPLGDITDAQVSVTGAGVPTGSTAPPTDDALLVSVTVTFTRTGRLSEASVQRGGVATFDLDLLLTGGSTAAPRVVAWSGPGDGATLLPYSNSVAPDRAEPALAPVPSPSPKPSASPTPTAGKPVTATNGGN